MFFSKKSTENKKREYLTSISNEIQKAGAHFLDILFKDKDSMKLTFLDECAPSFYTLMELSIIGYTCFDYALYTNKLEKYRSTFKSEFYEGCKNSASLWDVELTHEYFDYLCDEICIIFKGERELNFGGFSERILFTLKNDMPVDDTMLINSDFFDTILFTPIIREYLCISMDAARDFIKTIK